MKLNTFLKCVKSLESSGSCQELVELLKKHEDIILLGNGGSNAICSHIAEDYAKVLGKRSLSFSDSPRLTCYFNDYGAEAYVEFIKDFSNTNTLHILISSSGESLNIVKCADYCLRNNLSMITLSGFKKDNQLSQRGNEGSKINYWVDSCQYGVVELTHETFLHSPV